MNLKLFKYISEPWFADWQTEYTRGSTPPFSSGDTSRQAWTIINMFCWGSAVTAHPWGSLDDKLTAVGESIFSINEVREFSQFITHYGLVHNLDTLQDDFPEFFL